ncbi:uncharacterized protein LOC127006163 [Eriocheir sinensis]|uniref:uncharacterized protein LOC127006163 n=1 Tax=Eriocheir sinensis TaxID=95602 RepID=UPI0021CAAB98|nr:uncharacterized protein LOC127006163 [Eriocheir sinensis]
MLRVELERTMWPTEKTLELIELLHSAPALWNTATADYRNKQKKGKILKDIADKLSIDIGKAEKKIKSLRVQFRREHLKLTSSLKSEVPQKCAWFGYEPLQFLLQVQEPRRKRGIDSPQREVAEVDLKQGTNPAIQVTELEFEEETDTIIEGPQDDTLHTTSRLCHSSSNKRTANNVDEAFQLMKTFTEHITKRDEYQVFGENVAHKLRNCEKSKHEVALAQYKINEIIFKLEVGEFGEVVRQIQKEGTISQNGSSS